MKKMKPVLIKRPTFKYGSASYYVLAYAHIYDKAMTVEEFQTMSGYRFDDKHAVKRALAVLEKNNAVMRVTEKHWRVTELGRKQLSLLHSENANNNML